MFGVHFCFCEDGTSLFFFTLFVLVKLNVEAFHLFLNLLIYAFCIGTKFLES